MDGLSALADGLAASLTPFNILVLAVGVMVGMVVGAVPGIGPSAGIAILLPMTLGLDPVSGVIMLAAVYYGAQYGGTITSVLINVPGDAGSLVTTFDGHPLAKQGRAGPALVLAAIGSFVAGTVGAVMIALTAPFISTQTQKLGPSEIFLLVMLGMLTIIVVLGRDKLLGVISVLAGFAIGTIGLDMTGPQRFTFGSTELTGGIDFTVIVIGVFGVGEILHSLFTGTHLEKNERIRFSVRSKEFWPTKSDLQESKGPIARGSVLGFVVGAVPGAGATLASFMSYGVEKSISKTPAKFGKGAIPGLVGPETANNGASAGAMVPLLSLGLPGSGATAVLLTGFLMWGLQPGPLLMEQNPEFAWGLIASMYLGNLMLLVINIFFIPVFARIAHVSFSIMAPAVLFTCVVGTYALHGSIFEVALMLAFGLLGLAMRMYGFSPAAMVIALVLGGMAEKTLRQTLIISDGSLDVFWERGASQFLLLVAGVLLLVPLLLRILKRRLLPKMRPDDDAARPDASDDESLTR